MFSKLFKKEDKEENNHQIELDFFIQMQSLDLSFEHKLRINNLISELTKLVSINRKTHLKDFTNQLEKTSLYLNEYANFCKNNPPELAPKKFISEFDEFKESVELNLNIMKTKTLITTDPIALEYIADVEKKSLRMLRVLNKEEMILDEKELSLIFDQYNQANENFLQFLKQQRSVQ